MAELEAFFEHVGNLNPQCIAVELPPTLNGGGKTARGSPSLADGRLRGSPLPPHVDEAALSGVKHEKTSWNEENKFFFESEAKKTQPSTHTKSTPYSHYEMASERYPGRVPNYTSPNLQASPRELQNG